MQLARRESIRNNVRSSVVFDYDTNQIYAYVDSNGTNVEDPGEKELGRFPLPRLVSFYAAEDASPKGVNALIGFDDSNTCTPTCPHGGIANFNPDGSAAKVGAVRFGDLHNSSSPGQLHRGPSRHRRDRPPGDAQIQLHVQHLHPAGRGRCVLGLVLENHSAIRSRKISSGSPPPARESPKNALRSLGAALKSLFAALRSLGAAFNSRHAVLESPPSLVKSILAGLKSSGISPGKCKKAASKVLQPP